MNASHIAATINHYRRRGRSGWLVFEPDGTGGTHIVSEDKLSPNKLSIAIPVRPMTIDTAETLMHLWWLWRDMLDMPITPTNAQSERGKRNSFDVAWCPYVRDVDSNNRVNHCRNCL